VSLVEVKHLSKKFSVGRSLFFPPEQFNVAVDDVTLHIDRGEIMGLVGESGCGKTTLARILLHLQSPDMGFVKFDGRRIDDLNERQFRPFRKRIQAVFQDPRESLNPRYRIRNSLNEGLKYLCDWSPGRRRERIHNMLGRVGLDTSVLDRYPHQLSGGQRQRVSIARALLPEPEFIVCDEPTSALDVSIQAQIVNLLLELKEEYGLTYLFISHDLNLVRFLGDRIAVMDRGHIVEKGPTEKICSTPTSQKTKRLLDAVFAPNC